MAAQGPLFGDILVRLNLVSAEQVADALALQAQTGQRIGEALVALGYVTRAQLQGALWDALGLGDEPAGGPRLGELLVGLNHVTPLQLERALTQQHADGRRLGQVLVEQGACSYRQVYEALGLQQRAARPRVRPVATEANEGVRAPPDRVRVMVVDDSALTCSLVQEGLTPLGYDVIAFLDPSEALAQMAKVAPALVVTDLDMPGMDGSELCRRLKAGAGAAVPIIMLTANDGDAQRISNLRAGADDYVSKGASMEELAARIDGLVRRSGETSRVRRLFARYTSDAVVDEALKRGEVVLTGEKREVTVLFADIRNFTAMAESLPPERVVGIVNEVLARLADAVLTCDGTLDKFLGDGLMAVFGAPVRRDDDALRALQAAQMMMESMQALNAAASSARATGGEHPLTSVLELGVGINSGPVVAGNLGSARRTEYTCIGDAVNVGARLCALAGPGEVLVGERTRALVGPTVGRFEALTPVRLKGKAQPVPLFRASWEGSPPRPDQGKARGLGE